MKKNKSIIDTFLKENNIDPGKFIDVCKLNKKTVVNRCESVLLFFHKKQYYTNLGSGHQLVYKILRGKVYVISHYLLPPIHPNCRCM